MEGPAHTPVIDVEHLAKRYGEVRAVDDVSFSVAAGEIFGFLGHNGAGKTTTVRVLTGRARPTAGRASIAGFDVVHEREHVKPLINLVGQAQPANDEHDTPGICLDGRGYLHVVTGAHNRRFLYARSLGPLDARAWTKAKRVLSSGFWSKTTDADGDPKQTYLSMVCLPDDTLVIVYRQRRAGVDRVFAGEPYMPLCIQRRPRGKGWSEATRLVFCRDRDGYAMYHHKLAVDRRGRLFLSLSFFDPADYPPARRARNCYRHRMVLVSKDGGRTWGFATRQDYLDGATPQ